MKKACVGRETYMIRKDGAMMPIGDRPVHSDVFRGVDGITFKVVHPENHRVSLKRLELADNSKVAVHGERPVYALNEEGPGWIRAKNLKAGDYVAVPYNLTPPDKNQAQKLFNYAVGSDIAMLVHLGVDNIWLFVGKEEAQKADTEYGLSLNNKDLREGRILASQVLKVDPALIDRIIPKVTHIRWNAPRSMKLSRFEVGKDFWYLAGLFAGIGRISQNTAYFREVEGIDAEDAINRVFPDLRLSVQRRGGANPHFNLCNRIALHLYQGLGLKQKVVSGEVIEPIPEPLIFSAGNPYVWDFFAGIVDSRSKIEYQTTPGDDASRLRLNGLSEHVIKSLCLWLRSKGLFSIQTSDISNQRKLIIPTQELRELVPQLTPYMRNEKLKREMLDLLQMVHRKDKKPVSWARPTRADTIPIKWALDDSKLVAAIGQENLKPLVQMIHGEPLFIERHDLEQLVSKCSGKEAKKRIMSALVAEKRVVSWLRIRDADSHTTHYVSEAPFCLVNDEPAVIGGVLMGAVDTA